MSERRVYRFQLPIVDQPELWLHLDAEVLSVGPPRGSSQDALDLWALVDPAQRSEPRAFRIVGTGNPMPDDCGRFIGTAPTHGGALIWHVFEVAS